MKTSMKGLRCVLFARGECRSEENDVKVQLQRMRQFARRHKLRVVGDVVLERSAISLEATETMQDLLRRKALHDDFDAVLTTDLSRLSRGGISHTAKLLLEFANAGLKIVTLDGGMINDGLFTTFCVRITKKRKDWLRRNGNKNKTAHEVHDSSDDGRREQGVRHSPEVMDQGGDRKGTDNKENKCSSRKV